MLRFNRNNIKELKELLYASYVHDAKIENIRYVSEKNELEIMVSNEFFGMKYNFVFRKINMMFAITSKEYKNYETIISLTAEEDFSYLRNYLPRCDESFERSLYMLFQMLSGSELHIISQEVVVEIIGKQQLFNRDYSDKNGESS